MERQNILSVSLDVLVREWECASGIHTSWNHVTWGPMAALMLSHASPCDIKQPHSSLQHHVGWYGHNIQYDSIDAHSNSLPFWPNKVYEQWKGSEMKRQNVLYVLLYLLVREWEPCASGNHTSWNHVTRGSMTVLTLIQTACLSDQIKFMNNEKTERNFLYIIRASKEWQWKPCESVCLVEIVLVKTMPAMGTFFMLNYHIFVTTTDF